MVCCNDPTLHRTVLVGAKSTESKNQCLWITNEGFAALQFKPSIILQYLNVNVWFILYAKHYVYLEKLKENKNQNTFNIDFLGYLSKLKCILKIEKSICTHNNQSIKFNKFNFIYDNL